MTVKESRILGALLISIILGHLSKIPFGVAILDKSLAFAIVVLLLYKSNSKSKIKFFSANKALHISLRQIALIYFVVISFAHVLCRQTIDSILWLGFFVLLSFIFYLVPGIKLSDLSIRAWENLCLFYCLIPILTFFLGKILHHKVLLKPFNFEQVWLTGSVTLVTPFLIFTYVFFENSKVNLRYKSVLAMTSMLFVAFAIDSRLGKTIVAFFILGVILSRKINFKTKLCFVIPLYLIALFFPALSQNIDSYLQDSQQISNVPNLNSASGLLQGLTTTQLRASVNFFLAPGESDRDRQNHLACTVKSWIDLDFQSKLFGSATKSSRLLVGECLAASRGLLVDGVTPFARSTTPALVLLEYGLLGILFLSFLLASTLIESVLRKQYAKVLVLLGVIGLAYTTDASSFILTWLLVLNRQFLQLSEEAD